MNVSVIDKLNILVAQYGIEEVGVLLGWHRKSGEPYTYSYVHQAINGKIKIGKPFEKAVNKLYSKYVPPTPRKRRLRIEVYFDSEESYRFARGLSADERTKLFEERMNR